MKKAILILGGSSSIAKELAELHGKDDVYYTYHSSIDQAEKSFYLDLYDLESYKNIPLIEFEIIYSFLGYTPSIDLIGDIDTSKITIERNFLYPTLALQYILQNNRFKTNASIKIVTSVAGVRGRKLNYVYGSSKSAMQTLIEGLANQYLDINFTDIVLGPVFTEAVPVHNTPDFLISRPLDVARTIKKAKAQRVFVPFRWKIIMLIIRLIPVTIYNRLSL
jgi:decaprenylphospho-beta-D-erythro-pentofuranosid-2-ulose 2-reductase